MASLPLVLISLTQAFLSAASQPCYNPPHGVLKMIRGVDITTLDLVPLVDFGSNGFKSPVLNFTCKEAKKWTSPDGAVYQLPDQMWHLTSLPGGWLTADVNLYKSYEEVRKSMLMEVGAGFGIWKFAFSASLSFKKMQNSITNTSRYILDVGAFESATRADLIPSSELGLDKYAQITLDTVVNGTFQDNPSGYNRFIEIFGTHYFTTAIFGGYIRLILQTKTDYFYSRTDKEVKENAEASYMQLISIYGRKVSNSIYVDETFSNASTKTVRYYGGNTNLIKQNGISDWQETVDSDPWLLSGQLKPISDLISDETKRLSMVEAVQNHVLKSYLEELNRLIASAKLKSNDPILKSIEANIIEMSKLNFLVLTDVDSLSREVTNEVTAPIWFTEQTLVCFKWEAQNDASQCGGGVPNKLCAKPNSMTPFYHDNTDDRAGGCWMQWGIHSMGYPSWFEEVRLCYQWNPDYNGLHCGGGASRLLCARINDFTLRYLDDSDDSAGGCWMSWKLEVPAAAPLWMRTAKMCFSWYADAGAAQCSLSTSKEVCAVANQWTENYRDDTDNQFGGCRMSWGIKLDF